NADATPQRYQLATSNDTSNDANDQFSMTKNVANLPAQLIGGQSHGGHSLIAWMELCFALIEFLGFGQLFV
ncbi:unnamed protein product, partial [Ilex paraguariensis]